ncbi:hypothetical protein HaLaN_02984, partial [Haematococcus lacustris]
MMKATQAFLGNATTSLRIFGGSARFFADKAEEATSTTAAAAQHADAASLPQPSYTYPSPGSSMREPSYGTGHSLGNPTYQFVDPPPRKPGFSLSEPNPFAAPSRPPVAQPSGPSSSVPYVYPSPGSSMREPSYGYSMKDPVYQVDPAPGTAPDTTKIAKPAFDPAATSSQKVATDAQASVSK